jgi:hypothetical protein
LIGTANNDSLHAFGIGNIWIHIKVPILVDIELQNVLYAPECSPNLLSVNAMAKLGYSISFIGETCNVFNKEGQYCASTHKSPRDLYCITALPVSESNPLCKAPNIPVIPIPHMNELILAMWTSEDKEKEEFLTWHY